MPTDATTQQPGMGPPGRRDVILRLLRASAEPRSIASVADELGVHPNTVRFHLDALLRAGRVDQVLGDSAGRGRPPILFAPAAGWTRQDRRTIGSSPHSDRVCRRPPRCRRHRRPAGPFDQPGADSLLRAAPRAVETRAVTELVELLAKLGFEPEPADGPRAREIRLRHCPFQHLAEQHGEVICSCTWA